MNTRNLKIEAAGDYWRGTVSPKIRLSGRWLERAGFKPGHRVEINISQPGKMTLEFLPAHDNNSHQTQSATQPIFDGLS
jgi:hypothetical protein